MFFTIVSYCLDPDLHGPLFGKITIGFVVNNFAAYVCLAVSYILQSYKGVYLGSQNICVLVGYITLYTFTSFIFWINAMAANIFFKFSAFIPQTSEIDCATFLRYILYAQGFPLVLCIVVAAMDKFGSCDFILPNMGVANCFLGSPWSSRWINGSYDDSWISFFYSSEFIYFHSVLFVLQMANIIFFILTVYFLVKHWQIAAELLKRETKIDFMIVLKLFFITGIPWTGEFISHLITHKEGPYGNSFELRLMFDIVNLFTVSKLFSIIFTYTSYLGCLGVLCSSLQEENCAHSCKSCNQNEVQVTAIWIRNWIGYKFKVKAGFDSKFTQFFRGSTLRTSVTRDRKSTKDSLMAKEDFELLER